MALPNYHIAKILEATEFKRFNWRADWYGKGITAVFGIDNKDEAQLQALFFDASRFDSSEIVEFMRDWDMTYISIEKATMDNAMLSDLSYYRISEFFEKLEKRSVKYKVVEP